MTVEGLKTVFDWAAVILLFLTFAAGVGVLITGNIINERQAERLRQFDKGLTEAKTEQGKQQERAANADAQVEGLRLEVATANTSAAQANARAEEAKLALEQFKADRTLSDEQKNRIIQKLSAFSGQKYAFAVYPGPEAIKFLGIIEGVLTASGWQRVDSQVGDINLSTTSGPSIGMSYDSGLRAFAPPGDLQDLKIAYAVANALSAEGNPCVAQFNPQLAGKTPKALTIMIGAKP